MVPRHNEDRDALFDEVDEHPIDPVDDAGRDAAAKEEIATVDQQVDAPAFTAGDASAKGEIEHALEVGEEVGAAPPPFDARTDGLVEAQMRIRAEEDAQAGRAFVGAMGITRPTCFSSFCHAASSRHSPRLA